MNRKLKALGTALVAVFAMSAMAATTAQASEEPLTITPEGYPAFLTTESIGTQDFTVNPHGEGTEGKLKCTGLSGHSTIKAKGEGDTEVTFTDIKYSGCTAEVGASVLPVTVDMTGCDYRFTGGQHKEGNYYDGGTVTLDCPDPEVTGPDITVFQNSEHKTVVCTYTVWEFEDHGSITYENIPGDPDDVELHAIDVPVPVTRSQGLLCPKPTEDATYNGEVTVEAFEDLDDVEGSQIGVTVSEGE